MSGRKADADPIRRFWAKVDRGMPDECWLWRGARMKGGYGNFAAGMRRWVGAHVFSCELAYGQVPDGMQVNHTCKKTRHCVNPRHLYAGTRKQNSEDQIRDGTKRSGERHGRAKLTEAQARSILSDARPYAHISRDYGISEPAISFIKTGKTWACLAEERKNVDQTKKR
jgi:hypothetical protein